MFFQAAATINWVSNADPKSIVPVGPDAIGLLCNNIVVCYNLKTETKVYFKGDNAQTCAGISLLTGHLRFPIFAVAESVLRPKIYIVSYPEMEKLTTIYAAENVLFTDIALSDFGYLATLGDYPQYKLALWNYRSGECYAEECSYKKCARYSLFLIKIEQEVVLQYSAWHNQILIWQLCYALDQYTLKELATIDLSNDFVLSRFCAAAFVVDGYCYVVNDFGQVFWIDDAKMNLKLVWSTPNSFVGKHSLFYNKNGLIVVNSEQIYAIKKRESFIKDWQLEWTSENPNGSIKKVFSDLNNNLHAATNLGNVYRIQHTEETVSLVPEFITNMYVIDYAYLKGIKDEVVLLLTQDCDLRIVDLIRMNTYSKCHIEQANSIAVHNTFPYVAVGTKNGMVHFFNYEKVRAPVALGFINIEDVVISNMRLFDNCVFLRDESNGLHVMMNDYKTKNFEIKLSLARESKENCFMLDMFLIDEQRAIVFVCRDRKQLIHYATEAWIYSWVPSDVLVKCSEYELPYKYRRFTMLQTTSTDVIEFMTVRFNDRTIDVIVLSKDSTMNIIYSFSTVHLADIGNISGFRNVLTADTNSIIIHFRTHKKSKVPYAISRALLCSYELRIILKMDECFNGKYLIVLDKQGLLMSYRLPILVDCLRENIFDTTFNREIINPRTIGHKNLVASKAAIISKPTNQDLEIKEMLVQELRSIEKTMRELIDFDISVIGPQNVSYRKFCLNHKWLEMLMEETRILLDKEFSKLLDAIGDQSRIRDWIFDLIKRKSTVFSTKLRSIFSAIFVESYSTRASTKELLDRFDLFRFYEMEPLEEEIEDLPDEDQLIEDMGEEEEEEVVVTKALKRYIIEKGESVYEHVMAKDFELQDFRIVTFNQMYNEEAKQAIILTDALKAEFNKNFILSKNFKEETMDNVLATNATLERIYSNMNCMLCLLKMEQFEPPALSVPEWRRDENIQKILTVDDSEITAINRRKKATIAAVRKSGRMLLWSVDFWKRALITMMDGVLEKLWEEEIKKTPPLPEFMLKKQEHEYNLEDQKLKREYENKLKLLEEDRKKYLRILRDNEGKTYNLKKHFVLKLNEHIASINILKMKYDFAIKHERLRLLNMKLTNFQRIDCKNRIMNYRNEIVKLIEYTGKYEKFLDFYERGRVESKVQQETQLNRDRQLERQFKGQFLNSIPQHLTADLLKIYKKRPKLPNKLFSSTEVCFEIARRLFKKTTQKFPLPQELLDFLHNLNSLDNIENCPHQLEPKHWDTFTRLRRQRLESELRLKGILYRLHHAPVGIAFFTGEIAKLKNSCTETISMLMETTEEYFDVVHNQSLELTLSLGQVEIRCRNADLEVLKNSVLMHVDDIMKVNELIKEAGQKKLKSMQRVAIFRRQVIFKEWEHKVVRANIEYLEYILGLIQKCKITYEFLEVLRNWHRLKELKATTTRVGLIEEIMDQKLIGARRQLERLDKRIDEVRSQLDQKKRENVLINTQVDNLKVDVAYLTVNRDFLGEEKTERVNNTRMGRAMRYGLLANTVRADYVKILELRTILEITRWRTFEILPPVEAQCIEIE